MSTINFPIDYFIEAKEDGNLSLGTSEVRINDAIQLFENGDIISLTNLNKTVSNENELRAIIEQYLNTKEKTN